MFGQICFALKLDLCGVSLHNLCYHTADTFTKISYFFTFDRILYAMIRALLLMFLLLVLSACDTTPAPVLDSPPLSTATSGLPRPVIVDLGYTPTPIIPTATSTLVMSDPWTPTPVPSPTAFPVAMQGLVVNVLTPETLVVTLEGDSLNRSYVVRLLGIDAPANNPAEPWGVVAFERLESLLAGQVVRLVQDETVLNEADELPRYVYLGETFINEIMVEQGLAEANFTNPDVRHRSAFQTAERQARNEGLGLWGAAPTATPVPANPTVAPSTTLTASTSLTATESLAATAEVP